MNFDLTHDSAKKHTEKHDYRIMADYPHSKDGGEFYWKPEDAPPRYKQPLDSFFRAEIPVSELSTQHLGRLLDAMPTGGAFCIAGGAAMTALNSCHPSADVDVFACYREASPSALQELLVLYSSKYRFYLENDNQRWSRFRQYTYDPHAPGSDSTTNPVQVVKLFRYSNEYEVVNSFDFRVCQVAILPSQKDSNGVCTHCAVVGHPLAIRDSFEKKLVLASGTEKAIIDIGYVDDLLWRVAKYRGKGFNVDDIMNHPKVVQYLKDNPDFKVSDDIPESA